jgi:hypothetical protein
MAEIGRCTVAPNDLIAGAVADVDGAVNSTYRGILCIRVTTLVPNTLVRCQETRSDCKDTVTSPHLTMHAGDIDYLDEAHVPFKSSRSQATLTLINLNLRCSLFGQSRTRWSRAKATVRGAIRPCAAWRSAPAFL